MAYDLERVGRICAAAVQYQLPTNLMVCLGMGESSLSDRPGDGGVSRGTFQMNTDVWGGPDEKWEGLAGIDAAFAVMAGKPSGYRWQGAFADCGGWSAWQTDPVAFLYAFWPKAQGSIQPSWARCQQVIRDGMDAYNQWKASRPTVPGGPRLPQLLAKPAHANNQSARPAGIVYEGFCLHIMDGSVEACDAWFADPAAQASAHLGFPKDASKPVRQYVDFGRMPFANGWKPEWGTPTAALVLAQLDVNPNAYLFSFEFEGKPGDVMTAYQLESAAQCAAALWVQFIAPNAVRTGAALDRDHFLRHAEIAPLTRARCPGFTDGEIAALIGRTAQLVGTPAPVPAPPPPAPPKPSLMDALNALTVERDQHRALRAYHLAEAEKEQVRGDALDALITSYRS